MFSRSLRATTVPLVLSVWQTAVVAQTPAPVPAADSTRSSTAVPATPQTPGLDTTVSPLPASVVPPLPKPQGNGALFGASDTINAARPLAIDATVSVSASYDDDLSEGQSASLTPMGGEYCDVTPALSLSRNRQHSQFTARATTSLRHYPSLNRFVGSSY